MAIEIERKFLILKMRGVKLPKGEAIDQGYLSPGEPTIRVRTKGTRGFITLKSAVKSGAKWKNAVAREEYEYEIPYKDAKQILKLAKWRLHKKRHLFPNGVELDIFEGPHRGLVMAEFESASGAAPPPMDGIEWREVSNDRRYSNFWIARNGIPAVRKRRKKT